MEIVRSQILELIRSSLWGTKPSSELFGEDTSWQLLLKHTQQQAVLGSVYSQFEHLEHKPPRAAMLRLHSLTTLNRQMYLRQLKALETITKRFKESGIERPVLLKGVGVSSNYLDPGTRQCGDIDLYVGAKNYLKAYDIAKTWSECVIEKGEVNNKHFHMLFDGIPIEIHRIACSANSISRNRSTFSKWCSENLDGENLRHQTIEGVEVYLPPYNFDVIYIFYHAWDHFCTYGIAFRQICDWCRYLASQSENIDKEQLEKDLKEFGLLRPWGFFGAVALNQLGMPRELLPSFDDSKDWKNEEITQRIWQGGNFGFYGDLTSSSQSSSTISRKLSNFFSLFSSFKFLYSIDPRYSYNFLIYTPLNSIKLNIYNLYYTLLGR